LPVLTVRVVLATLLALCGRPHKNGLDAVVLAESGREDAISYAVGMLPSVAAFWFMASSKKPASFKAREAADIGLDTADIGLAVDAEGGRAVVLAEGGRVDPSKPPNVEADGGRAEKGRLRRVEAGFADIGLLPSFGVDVTTVVAETGRAVIADIGRVAVVAADVGLVLAENGLAVLGATVVAD